jgi:hypothetical protein
MTEGAEGTPTWALSTGVVLVAAYWCGRTFERGRANGTVKAAPTSSRLLRVDSWVLLSTPLKKDTTGSLGRVDPVIERNMGIRPQEEPSFVVNPSLKERGGQIARPDWGLLIRICSVSAGEI